MTEKIYIHFIDGTDVWVPMNARHIENGQFEIMENDQYHELLADGLFQFYPGDVVESGEQRLLDGSKRAVANKLISKGQWPDRQFHEFKYKATLKQLPIDNQTAKIFRDEIQRVKADHAKGEIFYPTIIETIAKLDDLTS